MSSSDYKPSSKPGSVDIGRVFDSTASDYTSFRFWKGKQAVVTVPNEWEQTPQYGIGSCLVTNTKKTLSHVGGILPVFYTEDALSVVSSSAEDQMALPEEQPPVEAGNGAVSVVVYTSPYGDGGPLGLTGTTPVVSGNITNVFQAFIPSSSPVPVGTITIKIGSTAVAVILPGERESTPATIFATDNDRAIVITSILLSASKDAGGDAVGVTFEVERLSATDGEWKLISKLTLKEATQLLPMNPPLVLWASEAVRVNVVAGAAGSTPAAATFNYFIPSADNPPVDNW